MLLVSLRVMELLVVHPSVGVAAHGVASGDSAGEVGRVSHGSR